jgi:hypothetical protein
MRGTLFRNAKQILNTSGWVTLIYLLRRFGKRIFNSFSQFPFSNPVLRLEANMTRLGFRGTPMKYTRCFGWSLLALCFAVRTEATPITTFIGEFATIYDLNVAATNNSGLRFTLDGSTVIGGLNTFDTNVSILRGSGLVSSLISGQTLLISPQDGSLLVTIEGDIRSVFPTSTNKTAQFRVDLVRRNATSTLRLRDPQWVNVSAATPPVITVLGPAKLTGAAFSLDPMYVAYNDSDVPLGIRNLRFLANIDESSFNSLDVGAVLGESFNPMLPNFLLSPGTSSADLGITFAFGPEPNPGNFLVAVGQVTDISGNVVSAFVEGVQATPTPEPSTLLFILAGFAGCALVRRRFIEEP